MLPLLFALSAALPLQGKLLIAPPGFAVDLVAEAPEILWPSAILCLDDGSLLVGEDPMDMIGPADKPIDRLVLLRFHPDGTHTRQVFAEGLYAIFGLEQVDDAIFVMNMPNLTILRDRDGDGVAEERRELITDLGPPAPGWPGGFNDHIVSGIRLHHDGYLYVSVGDKGIPKAHGTDGSTITLRGGGVIRLRPDGSDLELVASGLRNTLDVAIDAEGGLFTHDNTDDGLGWWTRLTEIVDGAHYGYPWDYQQHPERMVPCIRDYGGGSPTGGLVYREAAFGAPYVGSLFFCEWAKQALRRFELEPEGSSWRVAKDEDFLRAGEVTEFRPTDVCESPDGRFLYVSDWGFGGWTNPTRTGRIWRVRRADDDPRQPARLQPLPEDPAQLLGALSDPGYRRRLAAQRALSRLDSGEQLEQFLRSAPDPSARLHAWMARSAQGPKALALPWNDSDPALLRALAATWGITPGAQAPDWSKLCAEPPAVRRAVASAAQRRWSDARLADIESSQGLFLCYESETDALVRKAIVTALRTHAATQGRAWRYPDMGRRFEELSIEQQLDLLEVHRGAYWPDVIDHWTELYAAAGDLRVKLRALEVLAELCRKPNPWDGRWWSIQPARTPRPRGVNAWEGTERIAWMLGRMLGNPERELRAKALALSRSIDEPALIATIRSRVVDEEDDSLRNALIETLARAGDSESSALLLRMALDESTRPELRVACIEALAGSEDRQLRTAFTRALQSASPLVRAAALRGLHRLFGAELLDTARALLASEGVEVRSAALEVLAAHGDAGDAARVLPLAQDASLREEITRALERCADPQALEFLLSGLESGDPALQASAGRALASMRERIRAALDARASAGSLSQQLLLRLRTLYSEPQPILRWEMLGPVPRGALADLAERPLSELLSSCPGEWRSVSARGTDGFVNLETVFGSLSEVSAFGRVSLSAQRAHQAKLRIGSDDMLSVWLDGRLIHDHQVHRGWTEDADQLLIELAPGEHQLVICIGQGSGQWSFNARLSGEGSGPLFEAKGAADGTEEIRALLAAEAGDPARGWQVFRNSASGAMCIRCHQVHGQGAQVGPDLSDIAAKYGRDEILNSILHPSQRIAEGYKTAWFELHDGRVVFGQLRSEGDGVIRLFDSNGETQSLVSAEVAERGVYETSLMPEGLWKTLTREQLADLLAWLCTLKGAPK
jgi:putative heme-binding domain-containing protein